VKKKLKNLVKITSGYSFRGQVPVHIDGSILVIQAVDVSENGEISLKNNKKVMESDVPASALLQAGDILLVSRGIGLHSFRSAVFTNSEQKATASATVHVIRVSDNKIKPEYLSAYLNSSKGQTDLFKLTTGSSILMLPLSGLREMEIPVPDSDVQEILSKLIINIQQQKDLLSKKHSPLDQIKKAVVSTMTK